MVRLAVVLLIITGSLVGCDNSEPAPSEGGDNLVSAALKLSGDETFTVGDWLYSKNDSGQAQRWNLKTGAVEILE